MLVLEAIGNLGADAVVKEFGNQRYIAFSIAHTEKYTDGQGVRRERTTWVSCLKYGESAVIDYLKKGTRAHTNTSQHTRADGPGNFHRPAGRLTILTIRNYDRRKIKPRT